MMATQNSTATVPPQRARRVYTADYEPSLAAFEGLCSQKLSASEYALCTEVSSNIPIYDAGRIDLHDADVRGQVMDEFYDILARTSGVFVLRGMYPSPEVLDRSTAAFGDIIEAERATARGDHFTEGGNNDRVWNSFEKHALHDPDSFYDYYANDWLAAVSRAWLGPGYRVTAQVNVVKPGGAAQMPHRDYHLGFQDLRACADIPVSMHLASQHLTLQGAVAHTDMPIAAGPTRFLPFSQTFEAGFIAYRLPEFADFFAQRHVSLALTKGDAVFFNPALFHAAGANATPSFHRVANLLQVSSPFGKPMETIRTLPILERCWDVLSRRHAAEGLSAGVDAFVAAVAEGYPFPTNLDARPPGPDGMAPESEQQVVRRALSSGWGVVKMKEEVAAMRHG